MEKTSIQSTSLHTAQADEIVIRQKGTVRLVFVPTIVENQKDPKACVNGYFIYQKKSKKDEWEDIKDINLNSLKTGEGVKLGIKSGELFHLLKHLADLYRIHSEEGLPIGKNTYLKVSDQVLALSSITEEDLTSFLDLNHQAGSDIFIRLVKWLSGLADQDVILKNLEALPQKNLKQLNVLIGLSNLKKSVDTWETFKTNPDEEFWQKELSSNSFILSQLFSYPVMLVHGKAYVGGKTVFNKDGNIVDFLLKNSLTDNAALVEIKTPMTPLLGRLYRNNVYNISDDLSGSIIQVENYAHSLNKEFNSLTSSAENNFQNFSPHKVVIIGNATAELIDDKKRKSFELYRNGLKNVEVVTYDELFGKVQDFIEILENSS